MEEISTPNTTQRAPRSPPLAFQKTSNDALWAPMNHGLNVPSLTSPPVSQLFDTHVSESELEMQAQIDKQTEALRLQHQAFVAERESWQLEKDRLYRRISSLELLLKGTASGQSPARSPVISPHSGNMCSPPSVRTATPLGLSRLASIAEVEAVTPRVENRRPPQPLKRECAPKSIDLSSIPPADCFDTSHSDDANLPLDGAKPDMIDEVPRSPPQSRARLSPIPLKNRHLAGHTPLRGSISGPLSPALSTFSERLDTPTRSNTTLNETMTADDIADRPLKGPLMMPELPNQPGDENFTMSMLEAKLQDLLEHPEESEPMVMKTPTPTKDEGSSPKEVLKEATADKSGQDSDSDSDKPTSHPTSSESKVISPSAAQEKEPFDGGIKLRKKPSSNFGAPLGQMHPMWKH